MNDDDDSYPDTADIPRLADSRWRAWVSPLAGFLQVARTWDQLLVWTAQERIQDTVLLNMLAWLSFHNLAGTNRSGDWVLSPKSNLDGRRFPKPKGAGSTPAGDANGNSSVVPTVRAAASANRGGRRRVDTDPVLPEGQVAPDR